MTTKAEAIFVFVNWGNGGQFHHTERYAPLCIFDRPVFVVNCADKPYQKLGESARNEKHRHPISI